MTAGSAPGLWAATACEVAPEAMPLEGEASADVAIIGGGFTGLSTGLHLAEAGVDAVVLEAAAFGYGASGRNGGQVNPGLKWGLSELEARFGEVGARLFRLGDTAPDFLAALVQRLQLPCRFRRDGVLRLSHTAAAATAARADAESLRARGIDAVPLDPEDAARYSGTDYYCGGLLDPRGGSVHPLDLVRSLAHAGRSAGLRLHAHSPATALERHGAGWRIETSGGRLCARSVVIATNGYSDALVPGLARSLLPVNSFQIATAPLPPEVASTILPGGQTAFDSRRLIVYFRKSPDNRLVYGGRASFSSDRETGTDTGDYAAIHQAMIETFPQLSGIAIAHRWTGLVCITPDFLPHYHRPAEGLHAVVGFNGRGVALSVHAGAWLAGQVTGQPMPDVGMPCTPIRPLPFHTLRAPLLNLAMRGQQLLDRLGR
ncbi:MAG: FAD-binding oxidoreductase [Rhodobacteraceae bacterium]|nr:FAD-binding oxidoreductase [Paracoccaceae bacterium]